MAKLTQKEKEKIMKLRVQFPRRINVSIHCYEDGYFAATINNFSGCHTQGRTFSELINMVNDCLYAYFDIPQKYLSFMPTYLPSRSVAADFDFTQIAADKDLQTNFQTSIDLNEKVAV